MASTSDKTNFDIDRGCLVSTRVLVRPNHYSRSYVFCCSAFVLAVLFSFLTFYSPMSLAEMSASAQPDTLSPTIQKPPYAEPDPLSLENIKLDIDGLYRNYPRQRKVVDSTIWPWRTVGQVNVAGSHYCTGVLIAPKTVLTVAHCLWNAYTQEWYPAKQIHFVAGYHRGEFEGHSTVSSFKAKGEFDGRGEINLDTAHTDWAVMQLSNDLGSKLGYMKVNTDPSRVRNGDKITLAGYRRDRPEVLTAQTNCQLTAVKMQGRVFDHDCHVVQGDSGGPILLNRKGKWEVLAVQSLEAQLGDKIWGIAVAAPADAL